MKRTVFVAMVLTFCFAASCSHMFQGSKKAGMGEKVNGKWECVMEEFDNLALTYTFKAEGEILTGSVASDMGAMTISDGKVLEDSITFTVDTGDQYVDHVCKFVDGTLLLEIPVFTKPIPMTRVSE